MHWENTTVMLLSTWDKQSLNISNTVQLSVVIKHYDSIKFRVMRPKTPLNNDS